MLARRKCAAYAIRLGVEKRILPSVFKPKACTQKWFLKTATLLSYCKYIIFLYAVHVLTIRLLFLIGKRFHGSCLSLSVRFTMATNAYNDGHYSILEIKMERTWLLRLLQVLHHCIDFTVVN